MALPRTIEHFLAYQRVPYRLLACPGSGSLDQAARALRLPLGNMVQATLLQDGKGPLMVVYPATHTLDERALMHRLRRHLRPLTDTEAGALFADCEAGAVPPLGEAYGIRTVVENIVGELNDVCFTGGSRDLLVCVSGAGFQLLHSGAWYEGGLSSLRSDTPASASHAPAGRQGGDLVERIAGLTDVPRLPNVARGLLALDKLPAPLLEDVTAVMARDSALSRELVSYAHLPPRPRAAGDTGLGEAMARSLGVELALNMALGIVAARSLRCPARGPLGLGAFWQHALHSAMLTEQLCLRQRAAYRVRAGLSWLCGMLHNIGFLVLGDRFESDFNMLSQAAHANPGASITDIEQRVLGVTHTELGAWLLDSWQFPAAVVTAAREHHSPLYGGEHAAYTGLVYVADCLLARYDMRGRPSQLPDPAILAGLGLTEQAAQEAVEAVLERTEELTAMAGRLAAYVPPQAASRGAVWANNAAGFRFAGPGPGDADPETPGSSSPA